MATRIDELQNEIDNLSRTFERLHTGKYESQPGMADELRNLRGRIEAKKIELRTALKGDADEESRRNIFGTVNRSGR